MDHRPAPRRTTNDRPRPAWQRRSGLPLALGTLLALWTLAACSDTQTSPTPTPTADIRYAVAAGAASTALDGSVVAGTVTVKVTVRPEVDKASWYLDDPAHAGAPWSITDTPPYAVTFDTATLSDGPHRLDVVLDLTDASAAPMTGSAAFEVNNASPPPPPSVTVVAAGDISCDPGNGNYNGGDGTTDACQQRATSDAALSVSPDAVLLLGDNQYETGTLDAYRTAFDPTWGRMKDITYPAPGNHEYYTSGASGYYDYFGDAAGDPDKGYYSVDLGAWHVVVLNSNCGEVGGCDAGSPQEQWLRSDLAANPAACTLATWHHPRYSSGDHGQNWDVHDLYQALYEAGAELVLSGHDHDYERFAPQDADGNRDDAHGVVQFVVGSGGRNHYSTSAISNSLATNDDTFGVLRLTLHEDSYDWAFVPIAGQSYGDSGSADCHGAP